MDGTTYASKIEDELIIIMTFSKDDSAAQVLSFARYFSVKKHHRLILSNGTASSILMTTMTQTLN